MTIRVTRQHIADGKGISGELRACNCPIALAIKDVFPYSVSTVVGPNLVWVKWEDERTDILKSRLPGAARDFIRRFDAGLPVEPFTFTL